MSVNEKISTGFTGFDHVIDFLRPGDNVVWQVDSVSDYFQMAEAFLKQALADNRKLVYFRFGSHRPVTQDRANIQTYEIDAGKGFEFFATEVHNIVKAEGKKVFYVFDCLTDLLINWNSDLMIGNFFKVTCPFLFELDTVAYFAIIRDAHTFNTIAGIRETTQLLLDLYNVKNKIYVHPLKVWQRYSSTMFFPHQILGQEAVCITASSEAAELFSGIKRGGERLDYWNVTFDKAKEALGLPMDQQKEIKEKLMRMLIGNESRMFGLCESHFSLSDILTIASREVGTGFIGGKSVGMLVARKILELDPENRFDDIMEPHDSYYLGADIFYTYIVQNGWWKLRTEQKSFEGYYRYAPELKAKLLSGKFPKDIQEQFMQILEHFGQSPIIIRSSSLLEDNFGNAFAGKYESVFCANQGTPEERYDAFEQAVRTVYASTMNEDALAYRMNRGLFQMDEQMAILVQRVSGDQYGGYFYPHLAGVGNSSNLYVWDENIDMDAGMLRLVFGLGTRAVDRTVGDYAKIVCLDDPLREMPVDFEDRKKYSQHGADVISLKENILTDRVLEDIFTEDFNADKELFASKDMQAIERFRELGYRPQKTPLIFDFRKLLRDTGFPVKMKEILACLSAAYDYPVDIEFTANFIPNGSFRINLVQCRPLQTRGLGKSVGIPQLDNKSDCLIYTKGDFMGGNVRIQIDHVVLVDALAYKSLPEQKKYEIAAQIRNLNTELKGKNVMLIGPGRWGTTTPSLGVPVSFADICNMQIICEVSSSEAGFMPELSYGSHFFQDLVEAGIFYAAVIDSKKDVIFEPGSILSKDNLLESYLPQSTGFSDVIHVSDTTGMEAFSDIVTQQFLVVTNYG